MKIVDIPRPTSGLLSPLNCVATVIFDYECRQCKKINAVLITIEQFVDNPKVYIKYKITDHKIQPARGYGMMAVKVKCKYCNQDDQVHIS